MNHRCERTSFSQQSTSLVGARAGQDVQIPSTAHNSDEWNTIHGLAEMILVLPPVLLEAWIYLKVVPSFPDRSISISRRLQYFTSIVYTEPFVAMPALPEFSYIFAIGTFFALLDVYNNGANDVANSWATSVSSRSITYKWAMVCAVSNQPQHTDIESSNCS